MAKNDKVVKVLVAIPNIGVTAPESYCNRLENFFHLGKLQAAGFCQKSNPRFEFYQVTVGRMFVPLAREEAANMALDMGADYLYMIDDDMTCPSTMFEGLYQHDVDVVAPLAFTRNFPHHAVIYEIEEGYDPVHKTDYFINHLVTNYPKNSLVECDAVGFGAVLIKRRVLEAMPKPRFTCSSANGEDILFCHKAKKLGFRIFMDTSIKLGHLSTSPAPGNSR